MEPYTTMTIFDGLGLPEGRTGEPHRIDQLPQGTVLVSSDNHWSLSEDIFFHRFPAHLRHLAPRIVQTESGLVEWVYNGAPIIKEASKVILRAFETVPGCRDMEARMRDLDIEGVEKEIAFPNGMIVVLAAPQIFSNAEVLKLLCRTYNEYLAEMQSLAPGRFYGVGVIDYWDVDGVPETLRHLKDLGLKTFMLPLAPRYPNGEALDYCDASMAGLWSAIEASGLPFCFHIGESISATDKPGGMATSVMVNTAPLRQTMSQMIFGGILDRHPGLQIVLVESDINWIPGALQTADMICKTHGDLIKPQIEHHPSHYWRNNFYATFMSDPVGLRMLDLIGADRVMWSTDYPHIEGVFGRGWSSVLEVLDHASPEETRQILGGNAIRVFGLD